VLTAQVVKGRFTQAPLGLDWDDSSDCA
jgi:hypothetical protein